jgi:chromate transporter
MRPHRRVRLRRRVRSLPILFHEGVARHWMTAPVFLDGLALGQVTPGPITVTATS